MHGPNLIHLRQRISRRARWLALAVGLAVGTAAVVGPGTDLGRGGAAPSPALLVFQYSAKYLCGFIDEPVDQADLAPGEYRSDVNIHNPNSFAVTVSKKVVQSPVEPETGRPHPPVSIELGPDGAVQVDCGDVETLRGGEPLDFDKGFVVVWSRSRLDVVNVMTIKEELVGALPRRPDGGGGGGGEGEPGPPFQVTATFTVKGPPNERVPYPVDGVSEITTQVPVHLPPACAGQRRPMELAACPLLDMVQVLRDRLRAELLKTGFSDREADQELAQQLVDYKENPPVFFASDVTLDFEFVPERRVLLERIR